MPDMIHIQPSASRRVAFARWAVAQRPKVRTVSPQAFGVPADLFVGMPERVLIGALVDGHRYVSPEEDARKARAPRGGPKARKAASGAPRPAKARPKAGTTLAGEQGPDVSIPLKRPKGARKVAADSGLTELLGVPTPEAFTAGQAPAAHPTPAGVEGGPNEPLPDDPSTWEGAFVGPSDAVQVEETPAEDAGEAPAEPAADAGSDRSDPDDAPPQGQEDPGPFWCGTCDREFTTVRGRDTHRRHAHPEA